MRQETTDRGTNAHGRNKNPVILEDILNSVRLLRRNGEGPTFNSLLAHLVSRRTISNHRSLRAYLDIALASGLLAVKEAPTEQPNIRPTQIYSLTNDGPYVEAGEKALLFYGLNWNLPSARSLSARTDIEGLARARFAQGRVYSSFEDAIVQNLAHFDDDRSSRALVFCAVLLATKRFERDYLMRRADQSGVRNTINRLLAGIDYVLWSSSPKVDDIKTLIEIRNRLAHRWPSARSATTPRSPLTPDELVDMIGKQLGIK